MRIALVTDAWQPQVNGVVRTLNTTCQHLERAGHQVLVIDPGLFRTVPCPTYPDIRLALFPSRALVRRLEDFAPDAIHIATEGPLGQAARRYCLRNGLPFTTSFHTQFPEYIRLRAPIPVDWTYRVVRRFHAPAVRTLVPTPSQRDKLAARGFEHLCLWSRGVDTAVFRPDLPHAYALPRPIAVYMGRVAVEKNIEAFLDLALPGTKVVIGDGPDLQRLRAKYPGCFFLGPKFGDELASHLAGADVFVFPSRTDTFGLVLLEALACGLPVAAYPVQGPIDIIEHGRTGMLCENLEDAVEGALCLSRDVCVEAAGRYSWASSSAAFAGFLAPIGKRRAVVPSNFSERADPT
mgnify:CR=1 FL=1